MKNMEYIPDGLGIKEIFLHIKTMSRRRVFFFRNSVVVDIFSRLPEQNSKYSKYFLTHREI